MGLAAFVKGSEYETAASEVMNADIRNDLSAPLAAKHLIYQAAEGYDKVCTVRGKPETLEKAQDLMSVFWKALLEDMTKKGVKIDNEAEAKSEAERLSGKILIDSGEYEA